MWCLPVSFEKATVSIWDLEEKHRNLAERERKEKQISSIWVSTISVPDFKQRFQGSTEFLGVCGSIADNITCFTLPIATLCHRLAFLYPATLHERRW